jgi:hypothetical protein
MAHDAPEIAVHKEWLGQIQQIGLVVSPHVLAKHGVGIDRQKSLDTQTKLRELASDADEPRINTFLEFAAQILEWPDDLLAGAPGGPELSDALTVALPEYDDRLAPSYAIPNLALISVVDTGADLDKPLPDKKDGWRASPHARLERLLRATGLPIGLLFNHTHLRLIYAPHGESSGHLTFRFKHLLEALGRPMAGALYAVLGMERVTDVLPDAQRLPALLKESRKYQNVVSTRLAEQVLEALWELLRGFQRANDESKGALLADALRENPQEVYGGLLSTLMRLVFILYAEDRGLMPASDVYQKHYSVSGLFERLREDAARYPDTMDARFGAWAQLLALFRLIHDGGGRDGLRFPPRHGRLFNPDVYPFLEGRPLGSSRVVGAPIDPPRVPDGVVFRVLQNLLMLGGERLSYRALDVEQIGSVYEAMMGFALQQAKGPSIAVRPKDMVVNLAELLEQKPRDRATWLAKQAELKITGDALSKATTVEEALSALGKRVSHAYTPAPLRAGAMFLQPTEDRRRSGSHYTPRSLTAPIVQTTFRPIFERLGDNATPKQILDLKICDPAMGSGAFLVEACRLLAERLVRAWEVHKIVPKVPEDEDVLTYARRLVAERCLYGVDKNVFAVDLAKLSLWLATLARDHPFTFLDHALRHGDSLLGLSREQIACFNWEADKQLPLLRGLIDARVLEAQRLREQIQSMATSDDVPEKARLLKGANEALDDVRRVGNLVLGAFFAADKPKDRKALRSLHASQVEQWLNGRAVDKDDASLDTANEHSSLPFHWDIEFPEVFSRRNSGFDAFVGNPPFLGGTRVGGVLGARYTSWLLQLHEESHGNSDLVAHFFRRCFAMCRSQGCSGLIATNTIRQGDTRATGLRWLCKHGATIFSAARRVQWPGRAAVEVSVVHFINGVYDHAELDGRTVDRITAYLFDKGGHENPRLLRANTDLAYTGVKVYGQGFVFDDSGHPEGAGTVPVLRELLERFPTERSRVNPYLGGDELNSSCSYAPSRFVINFTGLTQAEAKRYPTLYSIVEQQVRPQRMREKERSARERWWLFQRPRPELQAAVSTMPSVIVRSLTSKHHAFTIVSNSGGIVFDQTLIVFTKMDWGLLAQLSSRAHEVWALFFGATLENRPRYNIVDCFESYPMLVSQSDAVDRTGHEYFTFRQTLMMRRNEGLTETYNRFHDPDETDPGTVSLREVHAAMDRAVLDAYGWTDIQPTCEFILDYEDEDDDTDRKPSKRKKPWRYRWPDDIRDEILGRLLELNASRAADETRILPRALGRRRTSHSLRKPALF